MRNTFPFTPWVNHQTSLLIPSISSSPWRPGLSASPYFDFLEVSAYSVFSLWHAWLPCYTSACIPASILLFMVFCMSYATTSHIFFFTSTSLNPHCSFYNQGIFKFFCLLSCLQIVTILFLRGSLTLSPIRNYEGELDILLISTCDFSVVPITGDGRLFRYNQNFRISKEEFRNLGS